MSRKNGPAVHRNRLRRLYREAFRLTRHEMPTGLDLVLVPRRPEQPTLEELKRALPRLVRQAAPQAGTGGRPAVIGKILAPFRYALKTFLIGGVRFYQVCLRPILPSVCRFEPSCSEYFIAAVNKYGPRARGVQGRLAHLPLQPVDAGRIRPAVRRTGYARRCRGALGEVRFASRLRQASLVRRRRRGRRRRLLAQVRPRPRLDEHAAAATAPTNSSSSTILPGSRYMLNRLSTICSSRPTPTSAPVPMMARAK